jgi:ketosteroid isomerase-like protein
MSNIETVQSIYEAFGRGDVPAILGHLADDVVWDSDTPSWGLPWYEPRTGVAEVPAFFGALFDNVVLHRFEPKSFLSGGDQVAVVIDIELETKATGRSVSDLEIHLWTFDNGGKVARFAHVLDRHGQVSAFRGVEP